MDWNMTHDIVEGDNSVAGSNILIYRVTRWGHLQGDYQEGIIAV